MIEFVKEYWSEILLVIVAIYGAILSTIVIRMKQQKDKRRINIRLRFGVLTLPDNRLSEQMLIFDISNPGFKNVTVSIPYLRLKDRQTLVFLSPMGTTTFPCTIEEGKKINTWYGLDELKKDLIKEGYNGKIKIKGAVDDQVGNTYETKWVKINLNI